MECKLSLVVLLTAALIATASCGKIKFVDCGNKEVEEVRVENCNENDPCVFKKGRNISVEIDFISSKFN